MYTEAVQALSDQAVVKLAEQRRSLVGHLVRSMLAGMYVGAAIVLIFTVGGLLSKAAPGTERILMGVCFGGALTVVVFAGSELFTGSNLVLTLGVLTRKAGTVVQGPGGASTYILASVSSADTASYSVDITGTCNTASATGGVSVVTAPAITAHPQNVNGFQGNSATFSVTATGALLSYQWRSNGVNIAGATSSSFTINNLLFAYNGSYDVVVQNCAGSATSSADASAERAGARFPCS